MFDSFFKEPLDENSELYCRIYEFSCSLESRKIETVHYDTVEAFYHGWLMGLLLILDKDYDCKSNREAGNGRVDIMLTPRPNCKGPGLVFELKHCDRPEQLPEKAE